MTLIERLAAVSWAPKALFLGAAATSFVLSVSLYFGGQESDGIFVGLWVPSILALGNLILPREPVR